jgi:NADH:ubiquinone oxidoreductase subunit 5 (subunit L)/multisubunit Na+/H+ antiporter MnhA subunit
MNYFLPVFIAIPALGFVLSLLMDGKRENRLSALAQGTVGLQLALAIGYTIWWAVSGAPTLNVKEWVLYRTHGYEFFVDLFFDPVGAVYLLVGSLLVFLITFYSQYYLHREAGYKRFFNTMLFFYMGYCLTVLSGNFETLFMGWEVLGVSSFLLIAFYRDRYLPVKNAVKVFSIYRIGDIGLILVMWLSHHLWHENITFMQLAQTDTVHHLVAEHSSVGLFIAAMLLLSAMAKSAMFPFSPWLPRAMEGPTPSSAIFYGSLSVHMGVFLLLRTFPFWEYQIWARVMIAIVGLVTSALAAPTARVQSSIKAQVAYASIAQIGLIFIELALGLQWLALLHFAGNAFLRTYQLLVSPSVVTYQIREQFYHFVPRDRSVEDSIPKRLEYTFYLLSLKEWNLESFMYRVLWNPSKAVGKALGFLTVQRVMYFAVPVLVLGAYLIISNEYMPTGLAAYLPVTFSVVALGMMLKAFTERKSVRVSWLLIIMGHLWVALAISFNERFPITEVLLYLSGVVGAGAIGFWTILELRKKERDVTLNQFNGHVARHPRLALIFLLCCLGLAGFPISPTFIGEDLMFSHMHENQVVLAAIVSLTFIIDGLAVIRIYARVFLGPDTASGVGVAKRSA